MTNFFLQRAILYDLTPVNRNQLFVILYDLIQFEFYTTRLQSNDVLHARNALTSTPRISLNYIHLHLIMIKVSFLILILFDSFHSNLIRLRSLELDSTPFNTILYDSIQLFRVFIYIYINKYI